MCPHSYKHVMAISFDDPNYEDTGGGFAAWSHKTELIKLVFLSLPVPLIIPEQQNTGRQRGS